MDLTQIKSLPYYDKSFKKLLFEEFDLFKLERGINNIDLYQDNLKASNKEAIEQFKIYFNLRLKSRIADLLSDVKDNIFSGNSNSPERLMNVLDSLKKQLDIWLDKIQGENKVLLKHKPKSLKLFCYKLFFEYCNQLKHFHNEILQFSKQQFKDFDFSNQYFVNLNIDENTHSIDSNKSPLMTKNEVADYLKVTNRQITNLENNNHFKRCSHVGNSPRYLRSEIENYVNIKNSS